MSERAQEARRLRKALKVQILRAEAAEAREQKLRTALQWIASDLPMIPRDTLGTPVSQAQEVARAALNPEGTEG